jgi:hypothetical protein
MGTNQVNGVIQIAKLLDVEPSVRKHSFHYFLAMAWYIDAVPGTWGATQPSERKACDAVSLARERPNPHCQPIMLARLHWRSHWEFISA